MIGVTDCVMPMHSYETESPTRANSVSFYYEAKEKNAQMRQMYLSDEDEKYRRYDYQEVKGMKDHHRAQHPSWSKAGNFYNIVQAGEGSDAISRYAIGLSRTIIDAGIAMMNEGEPEAAFKPITPSDRKISILWDALVKHQLTKCNWRTHQRLWTTDLHIFGSSPLEAFVNPVMRRPGEEPGLFFLRLALEAKTGLRHRSIWHTFRNPNVIDTDDVPSCAWEETVTHAMWVTRYAGRKDFQNCDQIPIASKYKITHVCNEYENTYRIYCLPFGTMAEASYEAMPSDDELGCPVYNQPLTKLNPLGKCPMSFGVFGDQLTNDYREHALYGMGIPQLIEGMEMIMEGLFNMTVDNLRLKNTVPVGYQPYQGQTDFPDLDNMSFIESGRVYPGNFSPQSLGIADLSSNTVMWEWINNLCMWITGYNFQQLGGDTSKTAFEFAQKLKANSNRAYSRLKGLENGPLKRSWTLLLANTLSQIREEEWENVTETQASDIAALLGSGEAATDDYTFENGKVTSKKFVEHFPVKDYRITESFSGSKKRMLDSTRVDNTMEMSHHMGEESLVPAVGAYLFPKGKIAEMLAFTVQVVSKTMLGDLRVRDMEAIDKSLVTGANLMQAVPDITPKMLFALWKQSAENAGLDVDALAGDVQESDILKKVKMMVENMEALNSPPPPNAPMAQQALPQPQVASQGPPPQPGVFQPPTGELAGIPPGVV